MRDPRSEIRGPRSQVRDLQPEVRDEVRDPSSEVETRGPRPEVRDEVRDPSSEVRDPRSETRGPRFEVRGCETRGPRSEVRDPRLEMRALPAEDMGRHRAQLKGLEDGLKQCRTQLDWKRLDAQTARGSDALTGVADDGPVTLEQATAIAEHTQKESKASLSRSLGLVVKAEQIGIATLEKMHEQEETFDRIAEDMEDIKANIQRSRKLVGQIARSAAGDRCIQCLCVLITIAVLVGDVDHDHIGDYQQGWRAVQSAGSCSTKVRTLAAASPWQSPRRPEGRGHNCINQPVRHEGRVVLMAFSPWLSPRLSPRGTMLSAQEELLSSWAYQPVHHAFCLEALHHFHRNCQRLTRQLQVQALRGALHQWQDLVISERLASRFAHAAQLAKGPERAPGAATASPASSPSSVRKSRIEVRRKSELHPGTRRPDDSTLHKLQALAAARSYAFGALQLRRVLAKLRQRRLAATVATWQNFILPPPLRMLLMHMRGSGDSPSPSFRWRAICGSKGWLLRWAEEEQASHSAALQRRRVLLQSARLLRGALRQALLRCFSGALQRWRQAEGSIAQVPSAFPFHPSRASAPAAPGAAMRQAQEAPLDPHAPLTHPSQ
eukprot:s4724_g1.t1